MVNKYTKKFGSTCSNKNNYWLDDSHWLKRTIFWLADVIVSYEYSLRKLCQRSMAVIALNNVSSHSVWVSILILFTGHFMHSVNTHVILIYLFTFRRIYINLSLSVTTFVACSFCLLMSLDLFKCLYCKQYGPGSLRSSLIRVCIVCFLEKI